MNQIKRIAVLLTCFNRRETTLRCLRALSGQALPEAIDLETYLVDDGCTDGTGDAVRQQFPEVNVIQGDGNLYWCGGMRLAWSEAAKGNYDYYLWLNDDVSLYENAILILFDSLRQVCELDKEGVVVGAICDPATGKVTYGGDATNKRIVPNGHPQKCDIFNGNVVLVPQTVFASVGNFDPVFTHCFGDSDYAVRTKSSGYNCWVTNAYVGTGESNPNGSDWANPNIKLIKRIKILNSPKGLPFKQWRIFARRRYGRKWPITVIKMYLRLFFPRLWMRLKKAI